MRNPSQNQGAPNGNARLTQKNIRDMLAMKGKVTLREAARIFHVDQSYVWLVWSGKRWAHLK